MSPVRYIAQLPVSAAYHRRFETTGWNEMYRAGASELIRALGKSWYAVSAMENDQLVGFGRVLSDGILYAVIFDLIVAPERQRQGIGTEILRRLLRRCEEAGVRDVLLFSAIGTAPFYEKFGFNARSGQAPGMILRRAADRGE